MATQDLTLFTKDDPNNRLTQTTPKIAWAGMLRTDTAHCYKDFGAGYFSGSWIHEWEAELTTSPESAQYNLEVIGDTIGDWSEVEAASGNQLCVSITHAGTLQLEPNEVYGGVRHSLSKVTVNAGQLYYFRTTLDRSQGTYGEYRVQIYSDASRTTLVGSVTLTLHSTAAYRYLYGVQNYDAVGAYAATGYFQNLDIDITGNPTVTTQAVTSVLEHTATGNGNITDIGQGPVSQHGVVYGMTYSVPTLANSLNTSEGAAGQVAAQLPQLARVEVRFAQGH